MDGETELLDGLVQVSFTMTAMLSKIASAHDLSLTQLRLLAILRDREPRMADLAEHLGLDRSSVSGLVDRAARAGLVRRSASKEDGRSVRVALTAEGMRLATALHAEVTSSVDPLTAGLSAAEKNRLAALLGRILDRRG
ncbi:MarR family winged helix-turn-helix transcriptional regulator [Pseudonocardia oroxyli]|uniref:DNA-binding transcriptional regulator, MarR family n=1 Tax=Pseudonocardia oroxyli TaxID=366584 RepID=A0A1G8DLL2_PSEOR|nr:MarR family transcriptional regulator [Pseudonocardia oroxyli]SDH58461.1 DNA-binding transcriptional regulator, MarR family [Pseudonocardia oroxyli]